MTDRQHSPSILSSSPFNNSAASSLELERLAGEDRRSRRSRGGVGMPPLACWDCEFESRRVHGCLSLESVLCCQGRGLCDMPITRPEELCREWCVSGWSRNLNKDAPYARVWLSRHKKKKGTVKIPISPMTAEV